MKYNEINKILFKILKNNNHYVIKDLNSNYIGCSETVAEEAGLDSPKEIKGESDYDMIRRNSAESFIKADSDIILHGKSQFNSIEMIKAVSGVHKVLVSKTGLHKNNDELVAILSSNIIIDDLSIDIRKRSGKLSKDEERFYLGSFFGEKYITKREVQVLKCILHGFSSSKMAILLDLSKKRIECIIKQLKKKLQCSSQLEIVNMAITQGWIYLLEEDLGLTNINNKISNNIIDE